MDICRATLSDAPNLVRLAHEAYWHDIARIDRPSAPMLAYFAHHITDDTVFIATNDMICGYLVLCHDPACWRLDNIAVAPSRQAQGIGAAVIWNSESFMAERRGSVLSSLHKRINA